MQIEIQIGKRKTLLELPTNGWAEIQHEKRLKAWKTLADGGRIEAMKVVLGLKNAVFLALDQDHISTLLYALSWLDLKPTIEPPFLSYKDLHLPAAGGLNLVAIEYPIADEAFQAYVANGQESDLNLLCGTLLREASSDKKDVIQRGDKRVPLLSRWEAEHRAKEYATLPDYVKLAVLFHFAGIKQVIHRNYSSALFEQQESEDELPAPTRSAGLGWWGLFFQIAEEGPFGKIEAVYQTNFHDICLYLTDKRKRAEQAARKHAMQSDDWGKND